MKKVLIYLLFSLTAVYGCSEIINISGVLLNRLDLDKVNKFSQINIIVINPEQKLLKNFQISIIEIADSVNIFTPVVSTSEGPSIFVFNENQINPFKKEAAGIIVVADHPSIGSFSRIITIEELKSGKPIFIEFNAGEVPPNLLNQDKSKYLKFRY